ncbi:MAG TPA: alpha-2-macroglobulin family protein, partial [Steroidobacteraceae bacterium]|nr:alpha-2-macroglobulin family protein [Steroidobacteraceae bacterium]
VCGSFENSRRVADYTFDDPAREFSNEPQTVFEGVLDTQGRAKFDELLKFERKAPGMLNATFVTRVFEPSGAFSVQRSTQMLSPYAHYVGIKLPKGDIARNMLLTDTPQVVELATVDVEGKPVAVKNIELTVFKIDWRWWWDQSGDSLAQYSGGTQIRNAVDGKAATVNGAGQWTFSIKYPEWGRYLIRACDTAGGHCAAQAFYIDWPSWAGRPQDQSGPGANMLAIAADKTDYKVGDVAKIDLPEGAQGRALVTIENGSRILDARWIEASDKLRRVELPLTAAMTPNVYVNITLVQPHTGKNNDRPLRMYGIVPIKVTDPKTHLQPVVQVPVEWAPESKASIGVSEASGRAMNYTLALVDEGLLGLTNYKTPDLHGHFYKREALGVSTWDLFDQVAGAYSADLERLLALGGSDAASADLDKNKSRFPPVVKFLGPFQLAAGKKATHEIVLPKYVGAVRVMVVAGLDSAYGSADKSVFVRQPLMILPTAPRVVGPSEEIAIPVSVFAMDDTVKQVQVTLEADAPFTVETGRSSVTFTAPGEQLAMLRIKTAPRVGQGTLRFTATSGSHRATGVINLAVRSPNAPAIEYEQKTLQPDESWTSILKAHGLSGTNVASLEVSSIPPLNLERRLQYLIQYPHGCLEQTTSAMFPQLFLSSLMKIDDVRKRQIEANVNGGIARLALFQQAHGGFSYWPGYETAANFDPRAVWSSNYVGHFLLEAERLGYHVPA